MSKAPGEHHLGPLKGTPAPHPPHSSTSTIIISLLCVGAVNWRCGGPNTSELLPLPDCRGSAERRCWGAAPGGRCPREAAPAVSAETRGSAGLAAQRPWGCGARLRASRGRLLASQSVGAHSCARLLLCLTHTYQVLKLEHTGSVHSGSISWEHALHGKRSSF